MQLRATSVPLAIGATCIFPCSPEQCKLALRTFEHFATADTEDARIAVKVVTLLPLSLDDLGGTKRMADFVRTSLRNASEEPKALQPIVVVLRAFPEVFDELGDDVAKCPAILAKVVAHGQRSSAIQVAQSLPRPLQVSLILLQSTVICVRLMPV